MHLLNEALVDSTTVTPQLLILISLLMGNSIILVPLGRGRYKKASCHQDGWIGNQGEKLLETWTITNWMRDSLAMRNRLLCNLNDEWDWSSYSCAHVCCIGGLNLFHTELRVSILIYVIKKKVMAGQEMLFPWGYMLPCI